MEAVHLDEDISLPTHKTLATLSVLEETDSNLRRRTSGDTIYYSLSDGTIKSADIPSVPVLTADSISPSKNDISMEQERVELPESPVIRRQSNVSKESIQLASTSADRLAELLNSPAFKISAEKLDATVMTSTPCKSTPPEDPFSPLSKPTFSARDIDVLKRELAEGVPL